MATEQMRWYESRDAYVGESSDGVTVEVDGDEFAEALDRALKERADYGEWDAGSDDPENAKHRAIYEAERDRLLNPDEWSDLIGINGNVRLG